MGKIKFPWKVSFFNANLLSIYDFLKKILEKKGQDFYFKP